MRGLAMWGTALAALGVVTAAGPAGAAGAGLSAEPEARAGQVVRGDQVVRGEQAERAVRAGRSERAAGEAERAAGDADLAYHGSAELRRGRIRVELTPRNHGPSAVPEAAVRLRWSVPPAQEAQRLPDGCVRTGERDVVCRTGALAAGEVGERITLDLRLRGRPAEVRLEIGTLWGGGVADHNRANDRHEVLVLDTGDAYSF
ncbi:MULTISPECIES: hypothetical protein [unclassified Streptomyces]|uniref:hypothetical protein n=1 Tax=unclassified Streptomyces TaxID=2593676 RepID=UPI0036FAF96C